MPASNHCVAFESYRIRRLLFIYAVIASSTLQAVKVQVLIARVTLSAAKIFVDRAIFTRMEAFSALHTVLFRKKSIRGTTPTVCALCTIFKF